ncbi:YhcN/YlaJ family sporulation lipoprotein [Bacillus sp. RG28]|uniref:YhcN/YlaJ family sporulation lipoprotein n=1 Tax=Gottfriedia endophytica TaxID=2820819 RepID=A0A940NS33_9BACI|nr:YhcN/YlaJ family sporulation lipoprotein [Gottfriedia endophytica]MBP0723868.1 YhcN/YlaJ family sporulation lipoprotein [Gottfriedia endophytica]
MNKKSLIITSSLIAALSLTACNMNTTKKPGVTNTSYKNVGYQNNPANPYPSNVSYTGNNRVNYSNGNDRINEGLSSEYINDGMVRDAKAGKGYGRYYTNNTLNTQNVTYRTAPNTNVVPTAPNTNTVPIVPYTNISTNPNANYDGKLSNLISTKVKQLNNVADANTLAVGNQILIAVDLKNHNVNENVARDQIKHHIAPNTVGKKVYVTFDPDVRNKVKDFTNRVKNNNVVPNATQDINNMINNVSNKAKNIVR